MFSKCKLKWSWCMFDKHYIPAGHKCLVGDSIWWNKKFVDAFFLWRKNGKEQWVQRHFKDKDVDLITLYMTFDFYYGRQWVVRFGEFDNMYDCTQYASMFIYQIACKYWFIPPRGIWDMNWNTIEAEMHGFKGSSLQTFLSMK